MSVINPGLTTTVNGNVTIANSDGSTGIDFRINSHPNAQGTFVINGLVQGSGDLQFGHLNTNSVLPLGTVQLTNANTFAGNIPRVGGISSLGTTIRLGTRLINKKDRPLSCLATI